MIDNTTLEGVMCPQCNIALIGYIATTVCIRHYNFSVLC